MRKIILFIVAIMISVTIIGQVKDRKVEKEIQQYYYNATDDYYTHMYDSAIYKLDILDFLYGDNANIKFYLGMCYFFKSDFNTSIPYFEKSLTDVIYTHDYQNGKYAPHIVYFYLGFAYEKQGNIIAAIYAYDDYIKYEHDKNIIYNVEDKIKAMKLQYNITD